MSQITMLHYSEDAGWKTLILIVNELTRTENTSVCVCVSRMFPHFEISLVSGMKLKILVHVIASNVIGNLRLA